MRLCSVRGEDSEAGIVLERASRGVEVMVKPPGLGMPGTWTSSHWPGRNCVDVKDGRIYVTEGNKAQRMKYCSRSIAQ
jgi:hypothetical protein